MHGLCAERRAEAPLTLSSPQQTGLCAGDWCGFGDAGEAPADQRDDDAGSLCFDSAPLPQRLELLGAPVATVELAVDKPNATLAVRLSDVTPDGAATRVTFGLLNLTHRESHEHPTPLEPGRRVTVRVQLNDAAYALPAGHRLRLSLSTSYWPMAWPSPEVVTATVWTGASALDLPVRPPCPEDDALPPFAPPEAAVSDVDSALGGATARRSIERDEASRETTYTVANDDEDAVVRVPAIALDIEQRSTKRYAIRDGDPLSARAEVEHRTLLRRGAWVARIETRTQLSASSDAFHLHATLDAYQQDSRLFSKRWNRTVPRDLV